jgi:MFS family permease
MWMMIGGGLIMFLSLGTRQSFGLFQVPMMTDHGWGREVFSLAIAVQNLVWGVAQPFAGMLADRWGAARTAAGGALLYGLGLYLMANPYAPWMLHLGGGLVVGMALAATSFAVVLGAIGRAAPPGRQGMAMGIAGAIGSMGQFLLIPGNSALIEAFGWSNALIVGAGAMALMVALTPLIRAPVATGPAVEHPVQGLGAAIGEAARHRGYWLLMAGFFVCGFQITFIATHVVAYVSDTGLSAIVASGTLTLIGFGNIFGAYVWSALGDRYRRKHLLSLLYLARGTLIVALLALPVAPWVALGFGLIMGILWLGTVPLTTSLVGQIFGTRYMTTLFGFVFFTHQLGAGLGVWLGGYLYDRTGSYFWVWAIAAGLGFLAALLHWPIADRPVARLAEAAR